MDSDHRMSASEADDLPLVDISIMAGKEGFEPSNARVKVSCLNQLGDFPKSKFNPRYLQLPLRLQTTT